LTAVHIYFLVYLIRPCSLYVVVTLLEGQLAYKMQLKPPSVRLFWIAGCNNNI